MGLYDDQIKERKLYDDSAFSNALSNIAGAVTGQKIYDSLKDESILTRNAIEEILRFYNVKAREVPDEITDFNAQLEYQLRPHGITRRIIRLDKNWYKEANGAILGTRKDNGSVVAIIPGEFGGFYFHNNETGKKEKINSKNSQLFDEEALVFYKPFPLKKLTIADFIKFMKDCVSVQDIALIVIFMGISTAIGLLIPKINHMLFGDVLESGSISLLVGVAILFVCVNISSMLFNINRTFVTSRVSTKLNIYVSGATMMRILSLPADFFKKYSSGEMASYSSYMTSLCDMLTSLFTTVGLSSLFSLVYIGSIFKYARGLVVPAIVVTLVTVIFSAISSMMQIKISKKIMKIGAKESGLSYSLITGVEKIRLSGAEKRAFAKWADKYSELAEYTYNPPTFIKLNSAISMAITSLGTIVLYYVALKTKVSVSDYNAFNVAYGMMSGAFSALAGIALQVAQIRPILEMVKPIMEAEPEISEEKHVVTELHGSIELDKVSFKYSDDMPNVIDDLSLKINAGQYVAIVGKTGCGKSTLARLLIGFEKPQKGAVYYDRRDVNTLDLKSLRRNIGVVLQNGSLVNEDIFSNITISAPWLNMDDAWEAAEIAGIAEDIRKMPMGMFTIVSEGSGGISGGQKQRLMIARAVAHKPKVLIFDEATSALDNITQKKVSEALDKMKCTRIVIAHRLSTIKNCDRIIYLEGGKIIEDGTYDELIQQDGPFAELVKRQLINEDAE